MPTAIRDPTPTWLKPEQASVTDSALTKALRLIGTLISADNPSAQVLALMNPLQIGPDGGLVGAIGKLVERAQGAYRGAPDLYSRLDRAVATLPDRPIPPGQVVSVAKKAGVKDEELAYRLRDFLAQQGTKPVTKAEVTAALQQKPIQVGVKTLGTSPKAVDTSADERFLRANGFEVAGDPGDPNDMVYLSDLATGDPIDEQDIEPAFLAAFERIAKSHDAEMTSPAKFSQYQVPGGEDYRETLLTLPTKPVVGTAPRQIVTPDRQGHWQVTFEGYQPGTSMEGNVVAYENTGWAEQGRPFPTGERGGFKADFQNQSRVFPTSDEAIAWVSEQQLTNLQRHANQEANRGLTFTSSHFDEPNILAHTRSNTRTLPSGEKGTFLEEVQSDWHQKGKAQGYQGEADAIVQQSNAKAATVPIEKSGDGRMFITEVEGVRMSDYSEESLRAQISNYFTDRARQGKGSPVPDAPFKEAWPDLALKHHLMEAANDPETAWLGFTGGQTQAARYDLSKQVSRVALEPGRGSKPFVLSAFDLDGKRVIQQAVDESEIGDYIGKEAAQKLIAQPTQGSYRAGEQFNPYPAEGVRELSGLDLQVGGEGMHEFYDKLLPKRLEKLVKPFGGTVEQGKIPDQASDWVDQLYEGNPVTAFERQEVARARDKPLSTQPAWFARLTPEMKARIQREGFPALLAILGSRELLQESPEP